MGSLYKQDELIKIKMVRTHTYEIDCYTISETMQEDRAIDEGKLERRGRYIGKSV